MTTITERLEAATAAHEDAASRMTDLLDALQVPPRALRVPVPAGGMTIDSTAEGNLFVLDLAVRETFALPLPGAVPAGFMVMLEVVGLPSGFQTASVSAGGATMRYRGAAFTTFHLIGQYETFAFISTGLEWRIRLLANPGFVAASLTGTSGSAAVANTAAWRRPSGVNVPGEANIQFGAPGASEPALRIPVVGVYELINTATIVPTAGACAGRSGVTIADPNPSGVTDAQVAARDTFYVNQNQTHEAVTQRILTVLAPGGSFYPAIYGGPNVLTLPSGSGMRLRLMSR